MAKQGKLSEVERHFIITSGKSISELAKALDRSEKAVKKVLEDNDALLKEVEQKATASTVPESKAIIERAPEPANAKPKGESLAKYMISAGAGGKKGCYGYDSNCRPIK